MDEKNAEYTNSDILCPTSDFVFKLIFGDESGIDDLTKLLKSVLQLSDDDYSELTIIDPHLLREYKDDKLGILDVKVRTKSGKLVNVELQVSATQELRSRVVFYAAKMLTGQMKSGDKHSEIKRVINIVITDDIFINENDNYHNRYTLYDPKTGSEFSDVLEIHSIELPKSPTTEDGSQLWWWTKFLSAKNKEELVMLAEQNPQVEKAVVRLMELSADERTRLLYESYQKKEWDISARERRAVKNRNIEVAREMIKENMPLSLIIKLTGLTSEEIEELQ